MSLPDRSRSGSDARGPCRQSLPIALLTGLSWLQVGARGLATGWRSRRPLPLRGARVRCVCPCCLVSLCPCGCGGGLCLFRCGRALRRPRQLYCRHTGLPGVDAPPRWAGVRCVRCVHRGGYASAALSAAGVTAVSRLPPVRRGVLGFHHSPSRRVCGPVFGGGGRRGRWARAGVSPMPNRLLSQLKKPCSLGRWARCRLPGAAGDAGATCGHGPACGSVCGWHSRRRGSVGQHALITGVCFVGRLCERRHGGGSSTSSASLQLADVVQARVVVLRRSRR